MPDAAPAPHPAQAVGETARPSSQIRAISHRHIDVFRAVMTTGSATTAAQLLHSSQPTISRELARLEQLLGYRLFERQAGLLKASHRALALFDEVQRAYTGLDRVLARAEALSRAEDEQLSLLTLPALSHALLPPVCRAFLRQHPAAQLSITPQEPPLLDEWVSAQRFDLALSEQGHAVPGTHIEHLARMDEVCVLPAEHPLLSRTRLTLLDFQQQDFISLAAEDPYRRQIDRLFAEVGVQRMQRLETHSAVAVCAMVAEGLGLAIVNPLTALACASERLHIRPLAVSLPFDVHLLRPSFRPQHALVEDFVALLRKQLMASTQQLAASTS
jgi:DNA-binding transcriptional LysR family regulator